MRKAFEELNSNTLRCDTCHEPIDDLKKGWLEWYEPETISRYVGFRICHNSRECYMHDDKLHRRDMHLEYFLGDQGLLRLLGFLVNKNAETETLVPVIARLHASEKLRAMPGQPPLPI